MSSYGCNSLNNFGYNGLTGYGNGGGGSGLMQSFVSPGADLLQMAMPFFQNQNANGSSSGNSSTSTTTQTVATAGNLRYAADQQRRHDQRHRMHSRHPAVHGSWSVRLADLQHHGHDLHPQIRDHAHGGRGAHGWNVCVQLQRYAVPGDCLRDAVGHPCRHRAAAARRQRRRTGDGRPAQTRWVRVDALADHLERGPGDDLQQRVLEQPCDAGRVHGG